MENKMTFAEGFNNRELKPSAKVIHLILYILTCLHDLVFDTQY
jgi:hypothetical protein